MRRGLIAVLALVSLAGMAGAQTSDTPSALLGDFEKRFAPSTENAAAEDVEDLARGLGIDARPGDADAQRPAPEDQESYQQAGIGQWLDSQIRSSDDAIAMPPARLREFLRLPRRPRSFCRCPSRRVPRRRRQLRRDPAP